MQTGFIVLETWQDLGGSGRQLKSSGSFLIWFLSLRPPDLPVAVCLLMAGCRS